MYKADYPPHSPCTFIIENVNICFHSHFPLMELLSNFKEIYAADVKVLLFWLPIAPFGCCKQHGCRLKPMATGGPIDKVHGTTLKLLGHHIGGTWRLFQLLTLLKTFFSTV